MYTATCIAVCSANRIQVSRDEILRLAGVLIPKKRSDADMAKAKLADLIMGYRISYEIQYYDHDTPVVGVYLDGHSLKELLEKTPDELKHLWDDSETIYQAKETRTATKE